jgi:hypothetical protein
MIRGFEPAHPLQPESQGHLQWGAALGAGFIGGAILLIVPRGSPWSSLTFFSPVIMGRALPPTMAMPLLLTWVIHLGVAIIYGLIISRIVAGLTHTRAIVTGGLIGVLLYLLNLGAVSLWWPELRGNEVSVIFTHIVFGLIAGGAYRGLLSRKPAPAQLPEHGPGA